MKLGNRATRILNCGIVNRGRSEKLVVTKQLSNYGWDMLRYAISSFYDYGNTPSVRDVNRFVAYNEYLPNRELMLAPNTLIHFSTGYTSLSTVKDILNNGLKCIERNMVYYDSLGKSMSESHYVVDTWQINSKMKYSEFAEDSPRYSTGLDTDRSDFVKYYAPAQETTQIEKHFLNRIRRGLSVNKLFAKGEDDILCRTLQNIGFIINKDMLPEDYQYFDIYSNPTLQKEFCGDSFLRNGRLKNCYMTLKNKGGKTIPVGSYGVASYLYGIPGEYILGVVSTYGMLYSDEICRELFYNGMGNRFIISPNGVVLYTPNDKISMDDNYREFMKNKEIFLINTDEDYKQAIINNIVPELISDDCFEAISNKSYYNAMATMYQSDELDVDKLYNPDDIILNNEDGDINSDMMGNK